MLAVEYFLTKLSLERTYVAHNRCSMNTSMHGRSRHSTKFSNQIGRTHLFPVQGAEIESMILVSQAIALPKPNVPLFAEFFVDAQMNSTCAAGHRLFVDSYRNGEL